MVGLLCFCDVAAREWTTARSAELDGKLSIDNVAPPLSRREVAKREFAKPFKFHGRRLRGRRLRGRRRRDPPPSADDRNSSLCMTVHQPCIHYREITGN